MPKQKCPHCDSLVPLGQEARDAHFFYGHDFTLEDPEYRNVTDDWEIIG